jgi:hypothetical protein
MSTEDGLRTLMRDEVMATERASRVLDVRRAMTVGRRQRHRHRAAAVALTTTALIAAAFVMPAIARQHSGLPPIVGASVTPTPPADDAIEVAPAHIDPAFQYLRFGWLPDGLETRVYEAGPHPRYGDSARLSASEGDAYVNVRLYPAGVTPVELDSGSATPELVGPEMTSAPPVNGRPAQWAGYVEGESSWEYLQWEYAPGGVIRVLADGFGADNREVAHRVAASLRLSDHEPVVLPFNLPGHELQYVALVLASQYPPGAERVIAKYQPDTTVTLVEGQPRDAASVPPNTTIDGYPAYESPNRFDLRDIDGRSLTITLSSGGARVIYENLDVVPNIGEWQPDL